MEDYNVPSSERVAILGRLQDAMGGASPHFWAACQICDLKSLEDLIGSNPAMLRIVAASTITAALYWTQSYKGSSRVTTPQRLNKIGLGSASGGSPSSSLIDSSPPAKRQKVAVNSPRPEITSAPSLIRNQTAVALAKQRDNLSCVLTDDGMCEVAHIYPFFSIRDKEEDIFGARHAFWDILKIFWPLEKVSSWEAEIFPGGLHEVGSELISNLITLSKNAHAIWNKGAFALKPISLSDDKTTLEVQFFWQKKQIEASETMSLLTIPNSTEGLDQNIGALAVPTMLFNFRTRQPIISGQIFQFKTDCPVERPLPSFKLLEIQWFLQRVIGMAGGAESDEKEDQSDSDDEQEIANPGLSVRDSSVIADPSSDPPLPPQYQLQGSLEGSKHLTGEVVVGESVQVVTEQ